MEGYLYFWNSIHLRCTKLANAQNVLAVSYIQVSQPRNRTGTGLSWAWLVLVRLEILFLDIATT